MGVVCVNCLCDGKESLLASKEGEGEGAGLVGGRSLDLAEVGSHPVVNPIAVHDHAWKATNQGPYFWTG